MSKNGWTAHLLTGIGRDDFLSLDEDEALKPRALDGSLPRRFGRLSPDSRLIDAGTSTHDLPSSLLSDFPFLRRTVTGSARDLGPYEHVASPTAVAAPPRPVRDAQSVKHLSPSHRIVIDRHGRRYSLQGIQLAR